MSWQSYVDDQLIATKMVKHAVIFGHDGNIWAKSPKFTMTTEEAKVILSSYNNTEKMAQTGITVAGVQYMYLSSNDKVIRAKKGQAGVHIIKTSQAVVVGIYEEPIVPEQAATVIEKLGEYLIQVGY